MYYGKVLIVRGRILELLNGGKPLVGFKGRGNQLYCDLMINHTYLCLTFYDLFSIANILFIKSRFVVPSIFVHSQKKVSIHYFSQRHLATHCLCPHKLHVSDQNMNGTNISMSF